MTSDGYVVVAGTGSGASSTYDFLAMKVDPMDGELLRTYQASLLPLIHPSVESPDMMPRIGIIEVAALLPLSLVSFPCPLMF